MAASAQVTIPFPVPSRSPWSRGFSSGFGPAGTSAELRDLVSGTNSINFTVTAAAQISVRSIHAQVTLPNFPRAIGTVISSVSISARITIPFPVTSTDPWSSDFSSDFGPITVTQSDIAYGANNINYTSNVNLSSFTNAHATIGFNLTPSVSLLQKNPVSTTTTFFSKTSVSIAIATTPTSATADVLTLTAAGIAATPFAAAGRASFATISAVGQADQFVSRITMFVIQAIVQMTNAQRFTGVNNIDVTSLVRMNQSNAISATNSINLTTVASAQQRDSASATVNVITLTAVGTVSNSMSGRGTVMTIRASSVAIGSDLTAGLVTFPLLSVMPQILSRLTSETSVVLTAENATTLRADAITINLTQYDQMTATINLDWTPSADVRVELQVSAVVNLNLAIDASADQFNLAIGLASLMTLSGAASSGYAATTTATILPLTCAAIAAFSDEATATANLDLTANASMFTSSTASAINNIDLVAIGQGVQLGQATGAGRITYALSGALGQSDSVHAAVPIILTGYGFSLGNHNAQMLANVDYIATASAKITDLASTTVNFDLQASGIAMIGDVATMTATIALTAAATAEQRNQVAGASTLEALAVSGVAEQRLYNLIGGGTLDLTASGSATQSDAVTAAVNIDLTVAAIVQVELQVASISTFFVLTPVADAIQSYAGFSVNNIDFQIQGIAEINASEISGTGIITFTVAGEAEQIAHAATLAELELIVSAHGTLYKTPVAFFEGDHVIYWSD